MTTEMWASFFVGALSVCVAVIALMLIERVRRALHRRRKAQALAIALAEVRSATNARVLAEIHRQDVRDRLEIWCDPGRTPKRTPPVP